MKLAIRSALLAELVVGLALSQAGCGGESLKPAPDTGPPPQSEKDFHKKDQELRKKKGEGTKPTKPAR